MYSSVIELNLLTLNLPPQNRSTASEHVDLELEHETDFI